MFEVNGEYINRKGKYTIVAINPPKMRVQYEDGTMAELKIAIQERIWENILAEQEAEAAKRTAKLNRKGIRTKTHHYIKTVSVPAITDFTFAGWPERVIMATPEESQALAAGDRIIFYVLETQSFVVVATITGEAETANPKDYFYTTEAETANFYPLDIDAEAVKLTEGVSQDSVELESQPNFRKLTLLPESFLAITEDDFELLAEILTEIAEDEEDEDHADDDFEEEEDQ